MQIVDEYYDNQGNLIGVDRQGTPHILQTAEQVARFNNGTTRPVDSYAGGVYSGGGVQRPMAAGGYNPQMSPPQQQTSMGAFYSNTKAPKQNPKQGTAPVGSVAPQRVTKIKLTALEESVRTAVAGTLRCTRSLYPRQSGLYIFIMAGSEELMVSDDDIKHVKGDEEAGSSTIIIQDEESFITNLDEGFAKASGGVIRSVTDVFSKKVRAQLEEMHNVWYGSKLFTCFKEYVLKSIHNKSFDKIDVAYPMIRITQDINDLADIGFNELPLVDTNLDKFNKILLSCNTGVFLIDNKDKTIKRYIGE